MLPRLVSAAGAAITSTPRTPTRSRTRAAECRPAGAGRRLGRAARAALEEIEPRVLLSTVSPASISIGAGSPIATAGGSETHDVSITLPPASIVDKVDVVLALDDTGSFASFSGTVQSIFSSLVNSLETALPGVDFGFGVTRFEDFGGPGTGFSSEVSTGRPFILNQPVVTALTAGGAAARNALISTALSHTAPGFGGDSPESDLESLYQIATGTGFDGNGDGNTTDSGPAGDTTTQVSPGNSGDVPAFASNVLPASGTLGGVGWRPGALHLVLLATDIAPATAFPAGSPIPATVTGAGGSSQPTSAFNSGFGRFGFLSDAKTTAANTVSGAVAPAGAASLQSTVTALNDLGIRVLGMGPGAAPTASTGPSSSPSVFLSALGRLTGAVDAAGNPLVFSTAVSTSALTTAIANAITTTTTLPVDIGLGTSSLPAGLSFAAAPDVRPDVAPGDTATFTVTFTGDGSPINGAFDLKFTDIASGAVLGTIPVTISLPTNQPPVAVAGGPYSVDEGGTVTLDASASTDPDAGDTLSFAWDLDGDGEYDDATGPTATFSAAGLDGPASRTVAVQVTDAAGATSTSTATVNVLNVAPSLADVALDRTTVGEGGQVTLTGQVGDPGAPDPTTLTIDWGDGGTPQVVTLPPGTTSFSVAHAYADDDPTGTPADLYAITVRAADDDGGTSDPASLSLTVNNVAPTVSAFASDAVDCGHAGEGAPVTVAGAFTDPGTQDTHTALVDWGDGSDPDHDGVVGEYVAVTESGGAGTLAGSHAYAAGGIYPITLTLRDDDTGQATATSRAVVSGAGVRGGILQVIGTQGDDHVDVNRAGDVYRVHANFLPGGFRDFPAAGITHLMLFGCEGNDHLTAASNFDIPTVMDGGTGNDMLNAGNRALMIGGTGRDTLVGGRGDDILVGGATAFDLRPDDLAGVFSGSRIVDATTVIPDADPDKLVGGAGNNTLFE